MSTVGEDGMEVGDTEQSNLASVSQKLEDLLNLLNNMHVHLEDCAIQWQSQISQQQWKLLNENVMTRQTWSQSILSRTYFADPKLDEVFCQLLQSEQSYIKHVHNFIGLLRGNITEFSTSGEKSLDSTVAQPTGAEQNGTTQPTESNHAPTVSTCTEAHFSNKQNKITINQNLKECFNTLMEAKLNFDTKFLTFDAEFHGDVHSPLENVKCICNICTNVKQTSKRKHSAEKSPIIRKPMPKRNKRQKRASTHPKSSRVYTRNDKSMSVHLGESLMQFARQT